MGSVCSANNAVLTISCHCEANRDRFILNLNDDCGDWNYANGQDGSSEEPVQKTALTRFEPAENRNVEDFFFREGPAACDEIIKGCDLVLVAQRAYRVHYIARDTWAACRIEVSAC